MHIITISVLNQLSLRTMVAPTVKMMTRTTNTMDKMMMTRTTDKMKI